MIATHDTYFWALVLPPGHKEYLNLSGPLSLSNVALGECTEQSSGTATVVSISYNALYPFEIEDETGEVPLTNIVLCTLTPGLTEQWHLDLVLSPGQQFVLEACGPYSVHLSGSLHLRGPASEPSTHAAISVTKSDPKSHHNVKNSKLTSARDVAKPIDRRGSPDPTSQPSKKKQRVRSPDPEKPEKNNETKFKHLAKGELAHLNRPAPAQSSKALTVSTPKRPAGAIKSTGAKAPSTGIPELQKIGVPSGKADHSGSTVPQEHGTTTSSSLKSDRKQTNRVLSTVKRRDLEARYSSPGNAQTYHDKPLESNRTGDDLIHRVAQHNFEKSRAMEPDGTLSSAETADDQDSDQDYSIDDNAGDVGEEMAVFLNGDYSDDGNGVYYNDFLLGEGPAVKIGDTVSIRWVAMDAAGVEIGSGLTDTALRFKVGADNVMKGLNLGIMGMKVNGRRTIAIPAKLCVGALPSLDISTNSFIGLRCELTRLRPKTSNPKASHLAD